MQEMLIIPYLTARFNYIQETIKINIYTILKNVTKKINLSIRHLRAFNDIIFFYFYFT